MKYDKDTYWWSYNKHTDELTLGCYLEGVDRMIFKDVSLITKEDLIKYLQLNNKDYTDMIDNDWEVIFNG